MHSDRREVIKAIDYCNVDDYVVGRRIIANNTEPYKKFVLTMN